MRSARSERELRLAVLQLSKHDEEDIDAILSCLKPPQRERLQALLSELGGADGTVEPPLQDSVMAERASTDDAIPAFLRRQPLHFSERFQDCLARMGHLRIADASSMDPGEPRSWRITEKTAEAVANAIVQRIQTPGVLSRSKPPARSFFLSRWFGNKEKP